MSGDGSTRKRTGRSRIAARRAASPLQVDLVRRGSGWVPPVTDIRKWASAALGRGAANGELAVRVVARPESRRLNAQYRGKDKPTNVLSFPVPGGDTPPGMPRPLGDLVICAAVVRVEALEQGKALKAHWAHLVVHGALHLVGYDHMQPDDAQRMERREISVLRRFGIANPYRSL